MVQTPDGKVYSIESSFSYSLFRRYLEYFDEVVIFARVKKGGYEDVLESSEVSKDGVQVHCLPYYVGFYQFLVTLPLLRRTIRRGLRYFAVGSYAVICRLPGRVGVEVIRQLQRRKVPYGIEVVGDPFEALSNIGASNPVVFALRYISRNSLRSIARKAPVALYVTKSKLQERYPCEQLSIGASDVIMGDDAYVSEPKQSSVTSVTKLVCVGSLEQLYKGPDTMLEALAILQERNVSVSLTWIGDGVYRSYVERLAISLGVVGHAKFIGKLSAGDAMRRELDRADIFVMPSRTEGLPRAMVEAMARGLPCVGTRVCGIEELLPDSCLVGVNDAKGLADIIEELSKNAKLREVLGEFNLAKAREYHEDLLRPERERFFAYLKELMANADQG